MDWTKKDYKNFCTENHLRYALDECSNPISPTKRRKYDDHLYWNGTATVYVAVSRETKTKYNNMKKKLLVLGCVEAQGGDTEGNFQVDPKYVFEVAKLIGATRNNVSAAHREKMRQRMQQRWLEKNGEDL
jgi:hypothetical protein